MFIIEEIEEKIFDGDTPYPYTLIKTLLLEDY
jgi:hypothetical protein